MKNKRSRYPKQTDPFYLSKEWRKLREVAIARDNYLCQRCLQRGRLTIADLVHHVLPRETHPELALVLSNLLSLCWSCHNIIEPRGIRPNKKTGKSSRKAGVVIVKG